MRLAEVAEPCDSGMAKGLAVNSLLSSIARVGEDLSLLKSALNEIADGAETPQAEETASQIRMQWRKLIDELAGIVLEADDRFHA
jgi:hypothetical protein